MPDSQYVFPLSVQQIAEAVHCPLNAVTFQWPLVESALASRGLLSESLCIAAIATIAVETAHLFRPIDEFGGTAYFTRMYDITGQRPDEARELGNLEPGDGAKYHGRGLIQLTGKYDYEREGEELGVDLVADPDEAKNPVNAAAILARFFADHNIAPHAQAGEWIRVRRIVNGGTNGLADFLHCVNQLENLLRSQ